MVPPSKTSDLEVLRLRCSGKAYSRISRELGLAKPIDAQKAFQRAFQELPSGDREEVRVAELTRLDRLATKVKAGPSEDQDRQLKAIERLRTLVVEP